MSHDCHRETHTDIVCTIAGESVRLMPERTVYLERTNTLLAADLHFGKAAAFRAWAIPVPPGTTGETLQTLTQALGRTGAQRLILLGDILHAKESLAVETIAAVTSWRIEHAAIQIDVIRGNHDRHAGDPPLAWKMQVYPAPLLEPPFAYTHHPKTLPGHHVFAGHLHPAVELRGVGRGKHRAACFWHQPGLTVLPAFGSFTGNSYIRPGRQDRVYVITEESVVQVGTD